MNQWMLALKEWNKDQPKYIVPRKGSKDYEAVVAIMNKARPPKREPIASKDQSGEGIKEVVQTGVKVVKKGVNIALNTVDTIINGKRKGASPSLRKYIKQFKDVPIESLTLQRVPVQKVLTTLINAITRGALTENMKKMGYDSVFHLSMVIKLKGNLYRLEKNEIVKMTPVSSLAGEVFPIELNKTILFGDFIAKTLDKIGETAYFDYNLVTYNCQAFLAGHLKVFGLWSKQVLSFVMQDAYTLLNRDEKLANVLKKVTDLGGIVNTIIEGRGLGDEISKFILELLNKFKSKPKTMRFSEMSEHDWGKIAHDNDKNAKVGKQLYDLIKK